MILVSPPDPADPSRSKVRGREMQHAHINIH